MKAFIRTLARRVRAPFAYRLRSRFRPRTGVTLYSVSTWAVLVLALLLGWTVLRKEPTPDGTGPAVAVWNARAASVREFPLEHYVHGVVAAEMPASFHPEAFKAQAVAARTYALLRMERDGALPEHGGAHISSDFQVHQAWIDEADFVAARPGTGEGQWEAIGAAVAETRGLVLTYEGELIDALYHSTSGGRTEDAARYFQGGQPYLQPVPDPYGDHSPRHTSQETLPLETVLRKLGAESPPVRRAAADRTEPVPVIRVVSRTETGRAARVAVGDDTFTGRHVRETLGLRSNWFDVTVDGDRVTFDVRGYGHGVGMPQYGADGMAREGYSYEEILAHYYPGTALESFY